MSVYQFLASDVMLENVKNEKVMFFSVKQALERGITLNKKLIANIDENKKDVVMYFEKKEDLGEISISLEMEDMKIYSDDYTNKKYRCSLSWDYTEQRAEQLINYIKHHLEKTKEIELWKIWLGEKEKPNIECCKLCELDNKKIEMIFKSGFKKPMCLRVVRE